MHVYPQYMFIVVLNLSFNFHRMRDIGVLAFLLYGGDSIVQCAYMNSTVDGLKKLMCDR